MILVNGCPRGGTTWVTEVLRRAGRDVLHEGVGPGGCVTGFYFADFDEYPCQQWQPYSYWEWGAEVHLVRDPLDSITSLELLLAANQTVGDWYRRVVGLEYVDARMGALMAWTHTHEQIERNCRVDLRVRLEEFDDAWDDLRALLGIHAEARPKAAVTNSYAPINRVEWDELVERSPEWAERAMTLAQRYGYAA